MRSISLREKEQNAISEIIRTCCIILDFKQDKRLLDQCRSASRGDIQAYDETITEKTRRAEALKEARKKK